jgi:hypothetical protein
MVVVLFRMDEKFIINEMLYSTFYEIEYHKYGRKLKQYIKKKFFNVIYDFIRIFLLMPEDIQKQTYTVMDEICAHCQWYSSYRPLQSALIQLCYEKIILN